MIRQEIVGILRSHLMEFGYEYDFVVEIPEEQFGDFSTNIALVGAKYFKKPPKEIAKDFVEKFFGPSHVQRSHDRGARIHKLQSFK